MNELVFEVVKVVVMAVVAGVCVYLIPLIRKRIGNENLELMETWATNAVLYAEQWIKSPNGRKKDMVTEFLKKVRDEYKIDITDEQINILIESAVKQMKMEDVSLDIESEIEVKEDDGEADI